MHGPYLLSLIENESDWPKVVDPEGGGLSGVATPDHSLHSMLHGVLGVHKCMYMYDIY